MKRVISIILCLALATSMLISCGVPDRPLTVDELLDLGDKYILELNYEQAILYYTRVIEVEPNNVRAYIGRGDAYTALQRYDEAISDYKRVIEIDPGIPEVYIKLADVYLAIGDTNQAVETLRSGLASLPGNSELQSRLDMLRQEQNGLANDESHDGAAETEIAINPSSIESSASQVSEEPIETTNPGERKMTDTADSADTLEAWTELTGFLGLPSGSMTIYDIPGITANTIALFEDGPVLMSEAEAQRQRFGANSSWLYSDPASASVGVGFRVIESEAAGDYAYLVMLEGKVYGIEFTGESLQRLWGFSYGITTKDEVSRVLTEENYQEMNGYIYYIYEGNGRLYFRFDSDFRLFPFCGIYWQ